MQAWGCMQYDDVPEIATPKTRGCCAWVRYYLRKYFGSSVETHVTEYKCDDGKTTCDTDAADEKKHNTVDTQPAPLLAAMCVDNATPTNH